MVSVFSIPAFFIVLREVLEACLVVGIVLAYLSKVGATQYRKWVWIGAAAGILVSVIVGIVFAVIFYVNNDQIFTGDAEKTFEGIAFLVAAALLTWMIIWMMYMGKALQQNMEKQVDQIVDSEHSPLRRKLSIFLMIFVQVLREGIETVVFLIGTANADDVGGWRAIPLAGILAIIVGVAVSFLVFRGLVNLDIVKFFYISGFVLIAFAAGLVSHAFHEFQEIDLFGPWDPQPPAQRDWYNAAMWSTDGCCNDKTNEFFSMLRALFGYQDKPTFVEWGTYFAYWLIVVAIFVVINWRHIRAARHATATRAKALTLLSLLFTFVAFVFVLINRTWIGLLTMVLAFVLSVAATLFVFDLTHRFLKPLAPFRRVAVLSCGVCFALLTVLMTVLHIVQMDCEGRDACSLDMFFFFGLIFDPDFLQLGRQQGNWPALAAFSFSIVITFYFFGALSFLLILHAMNIAQDGEFIGDDHAMLKGGDMEDVSDPVESDDPVDPALDKPDPTAQAIPVAM
eukprot:GFKZ01010097.1.p1 GENE.GFKZ01010097.1~~GFKZ01010097.1.p1  ORF type:complete len:527 (-),score=80.46 GFKZ01010097.1:467-1996(-)